MDSNELAKLLDDFKLEALLKFNRGRIEHGEKFEEIDYFNEMKGEIIDLLIYLLLREKYQKHD